MPEDPIDPEGSHRSAVVRGTGVTPSERYLQQLCERTFLSLWSYPAVFRDQGGRAGDGKEIADLLVVFEEHVIIFSDKHIEFPSSDDSTRDWERWYRRAIDGAAKQVWGAERWIREFPNRIFLDRRCTQKFPYYFPIQPRPSSIGL